MIEINLIPDVKLELIKAQKIRAAVISISIILSIVAASAVAVLAIYIFTVQTVRINILDASIKKGSSQLQEVKDLSKTLTIQNQLTKIATLNDQKKISSRTFDVISAIIPPAPNNVQISNLVVDTSSKKITIEGQAQNSYAAVEVFKKTITGAKLKYTTASGEKKEVVLASNIDTSDTSYGEDSSGRKVLRFKLTFIYASELMASYNKEISISISNGGNATDSYLGVPQSIFVDKAKDIQEGI
jgi:Tfp pilus assembly protein PilN